jgi:hypothetical protein
MDRLASAAFLLVLRKTVLRLLVFAGLSLIAAALAFCFGPFTLDAFTSSAPPM